MTEGPFYPQPAWRARGPFAGDWDADLTRVMRGGRERVAEGEPLGLELQVRDTRGRALDGAVVEIWQCDTWGRYRHPRDGAQPAEVDEGFQGYGEARASAQGTVAFRTIRPAPYAGRTPHIHLKFATRALARSPRSFSWKATPATRATSSGAPEFDTKRCKWLICIEATLSAATTARAFER